MRVRGVWMRALPVLIVAAAAFIGIKEKTHFELSEELEFSFTNEDDVIKAIHDGLAVHARSFTIAYQAEGDYLGGMEALVNELVSHAMYNTDAPTEGDYVRYQYGGYRLSCQKSDGGNANAYQLTITPVYYSTVEEERKVDERVAEILESLSLGENASEREKVQAVYDYVCGNVKYDRVHENNSHYYRDSTAYAALVEKYASCQGYAVAVFRLLKELGVECRVVTGTGTNNLGKDEFHAWNEVLIDGEYYNIDATWDAGKENYDYFLIKDEAFVNHVKSDFQENAD